MSTRLRYVLLVAVLALWTAPLHAGTAGADLPYNAPLRTFTDNLTGPTAKILVTVFFAIGGLIWGFGRHSEGASRVGQAVMGASLLLSAPTITTALGITGALF